MANITESLSLLADKVSECAVSGMPVIITTHADCDGLATGAILAKAAIRAGARCSVHAQKEFDSESAKSLDRSAFHVIADVGNGLSADLDASVGENWLMVDHHEVPASEYDNARVINAWKYGIDGGSEACSASMAYMAAAVLDRRNADLAPVAVIGALGDRQDQGVKRSLAGKNLEISERAVETGLLKVDEDLLLAGRETRALRDAIAFTTRPFIEGLTWNPGASSELLKKADIKTKSNGRYRVASELGEDEKRAIADGMASYAEGMSSEEIMAELVGCSYTLTREGLQSFLRDAREFATVLNSCGRIGKAGVGVALCMGDRTETVRVAEEVLADYRRLIRDCMERIASERWRVAETGTCVMVNAEGVVGESMTGTISSMIAGAPSNSGKIIVLRASSDGGRVKFSSRKSRGCAADVNLSSVMRDGAALFDGIGGGHESAAGARVSKSNLSGFLDYIEENVSKVRGTDSDT